jgi:hypothetical protein
VPTATVSITPVTASATPARSFEKTCLAYPNPARQRMLFSFNLARDARAEVWIYNLSGETVAALQGDLTAGQGRTLVWDCSGAAPGVYLVRFLADGVEIGKQKAALVR